MHTEFSADYLDQCRAALAREQAHSLAQTDQWSHVDRAQVHRDWDALYTRLAPLVPQLPASAPQVQALMAEHYALVSRFYAPSRKAYIGMGLFYAEDADMARFHQGYHPGLVAFLGQAMPVYAQAHLAD